MECLKDLVGIKNICDTPVSKSGLWIQDLQGFSLKLADAAVNEETISGIQLINDKYNKAQQSILAQFRNQFEDKIRANSIIENEVIGYYPSRIKSISANNTFLKGVRIEIRDYAYLEIYISQIALFFKDSIADANIYIYNLMNGQLLDTFTIITIAEQPTYISINKAYPTNKQRLSLFICFDAGLSDVFESSVFNVDNVNCSHCKDGMQSNRYAYVSGAKIDKALQKISGNIISNSGTSGMSLDYSINCNIDNLLCSVAGKFAWPLLHKWGAEILAELQYSRRLNSIITIDKKDNEALRMEYENEYMSSMNAIFNNIKLPSDICFSCNSSIKKVVRIP